MKNNFEFQEVQATPEGVRAVFVETKIAEDEEREIQWKPKTNIEPHKDLLSQFRKLNQYLRKAYNLSETEKVTAHKISINGKDDTKGVIIYGKQPTWNNAHNDLITSKITFSSDSIGIEGKVQKIVDDICEEAYKYFYEGKAANPQFFGFSEDKAA